MEKRSRQRRKTRLTIRFGVDRPEKMGLITNVSARGIYISTNSILPPGSPVRVQVPVPGSEPMQLDGKVMRTRRVPAAFIMVNTGGMGVRLVNAPAAWPASQEVPDEP